MPTRVAYTAAQVSAAEVPHLDAGEPLMRRAASALAAVLRHELETSGAADLTAEDVQRRRRVVVVLVGPGNNGGDALFAAAELAADGVDVRVVPVVGSRMHEEGRAAAASAGVAWLSVEPVDAFSAVVSQADLLVDGMFGTGSAGQDPALRGGARTAVDAVLALPVDARPRVIAVDIPSGIDADTGEVPDPAVLAAVTTVTFGGLKAGVLLAPASHYVGRIALVDIGIGDQLAGMDPALSMDLPSELVDDFRGRIGPR